MVVGYKVVVIYWWWLYTLTLTYFGYSASKSELGPGTNMRVHLFMLSAEVVGYVWYRNI